MGFESRHSQQLNNGTASLEHATNGRIHAVSPSRLQRIHGYNERWKAVNGQDLFTGSAASSERPLRDVLTNGLGNIRGPVILADVGAGSGTDVVRFAREVPNAEVDAIEATENGAKRLRAKVLAEESTFAPGSHINVQEVDAFGHLASQAARYDRIQEHSFAHLFGPDERPELYTATRLALKADGVALISFKAIGDSKDVGEKVGEDPLGYLRQDPKYPGIVRLFVASEELMVVELAKNGLRVVKTDHWPEVNYDGKDDNGNDTIAWFRGALVAPA